MFKSGLSFKDKLARGLAGLLILLAICLKQIFEIETSWFMFLIGLNLFQYGITGYCPFASWFLKIGWLQKV